MQQREKVRVLPFCGWQHYWLSLKQRWSHGDGIIRWKKRKENFSIFSFKSGFIKFIFQELEAFFLLLHLAVREGTQWIQHFLDLCEKNNEKDNLTLDLFYLPSSGLSTLFRFKVGRKEEKDIFSFSIYGFELSSSTHQIFRLKNSVQVNNIFNIFSFHFFPLKSFKALESFNFYCSIAFFYCQLLVFLIIIFISSLLAVFPPLWQIIIAVKQE